MNNSLHSAHSEPPARSSHPLHPSDPHYNDFAMAVAISAIVSRVYSLGIDVHKALAQLVPLDSLPHDTILDQALIDQCQAKIGIFEPAIMRLVSVKGHTDTALWNLRQGSADLDELLHGADADYYGEAMRRSLRSLEKMAERITELYDRFHASCESTPFAVRKRTLAGLVLVCSEVLQKSEDVIQSRADSSPHLLNQVKAFEKRVRKVRSTFTRLRDNPSQKMGKSLQQLADDIDAIHQGLVALEVTAFRIPKIGPGRVGLGYNQMPSLAAAT